MQTDIAPVLALREKIVTELDPELKAELGELELKVTTSYTLADAIREGASVTPQARGTWVRGGASCALGASWIAAKARGYVK